MSDRRFGQWLSLARQGFSLERDFGTHSLETLVSVAEMIEESVYERGSLSRSSSGLTFRLTNPPLRTGAFSAVRLTVDGAAVPAERARVRVGAAAPWRPFGEISGAQPLELRPGDRSEISIEGATLGAGRQCTVRLEFQSTAIPPLVWFEFTDAVHGADPA